MSIFKRQGEKDVDADIRCVQGRGIEVKLEKYTRLMVSARGISYWYPEYQEFLLGKLHPFLPRMEYDPENDTVTASMVAGGKEVLGGSRCIKSIADIPPAAHRELVCKIKELVQEVSRAGADPDIKRVIENFSLPDPRYSPELYRVYGKDKLAVLWGLEKRDAGPPIALFDWSKTCPPPPPPSNPWLRRILLAILCMVLVGGGAWLCCEHGKDICNRIGDLIEKIIAMIRKPDPPPPTVVEGLKQSLYEVQSIRNGEVIGTSEAFAVNLDGTMITGAGALKEYGTPGVIYRVISPNGLSYTMGDVHVNNDEGIAVFRANVDKGIPCLKPRDEEKPKLGEEVYVYDPRNKFLKPGKVNFVDDKQAPDGITYFSHDADLDSDLGGCPVLDSQGRVLGVVPAAGKGTPQRDTAVWVDDLKKLKVYPEQPVQPVRPPVVPPVGPELESDSIDVQEAKQAADNAEDAVAAGDPEKARREADRSQAAADRAERKSREYPSPENKKSAIDAQSHADRACSAAAYADPLRAMGNIYMAKDKVNKFLNDAKDAARMDDFQRLERLSHDASRAARGADNKAKGIAQKAMCTRTPEDEEHAEEARRYADEIRNIADEVCKTAQREIIVEVDGMRFVTEPILDRQSEPGKIWVNVRVDASDVEKGTIKGVRLDGRNSAAIQIKADGEEVPYSVTCKGWEYPKAGSLRLRVSEH